MLVEQWRTEYNRVRPHSSLDYRAPAPEAVEPSTSGASRLTLGVAQKGGQVTRIIPIEKWSDNDNLKAFPLSSLKDCKNSRAAAGRDLHQAFQTEQVSSLLTQVDGSKPEHDP